MAAGVRQPRWCMDPTATAGGAGRTQDPAPAPAQGSIPFSRLARAARKRGMAILHSTLPHAPWTDPRLSRLPGVQPLDPAQWLIRDEAFAAQMAERDRLIAARPEAVHALLPRGEAAAAELCTLVMDRLDAGYLRAGDRVIRPDGVAVPLDPARPLLTLGRLVQADLCLLEQDGAEHVLTGAILCFPASWTLSEKIGRPLTGIHRPVDVYDEGLARRVQRLFDGIRPEQPLWRANALLYADPALHQPKAEGDRRPRPPGRDYLRSEHQALLRLPRSRAVVFSIHTYVLALAALPAAEAAAIRAALP